MCRKIVKKIFSLVFKIVFSRKKLDFVIIGAQKSGTTALFNYLNMHPFCVGAPRKETFFFSHYYREKGLCVREDSEQEYFACLKDPDKYPFTWFVEEEFRKIALHDSYLPSAFNYPDFIRHGLYSEQLDRGMKNFLRKQGVGLNGLNNKVYE